MTDLEIVLLDAARYRFIRDSLVNQGVVRLGESCITNGDDWLVINDCAEFDALADEEMNRQLTGV